MSRQPPTVGIIGGGQLGRMLALAAARLGIRAHIYDPHEAPCAAEVACKFTRAAFDDADALARFAAEVDVVTYEFENLPSAPLAALGDKLRPGVRSLTVSQDRAEEKAFITATGAKVAPWRPIDTLDDVHAAIVALGLPLVLKTRRYGYDGKGQAWVHGAENADEAFASIGNQPAVAEQAVAFDAEFSVILARTENGECRAFDSPRNIHEAGILRRSILPAGEAIAPHFTIARAQAAAIAEALGHIGVLTVEFFACADGPLVNEIAPRVHNSGHWTIEAAATSQFEQHIRAVCGLPLGATTLRGERVEMRNLIGDEIEQWPALLAEEGAALHHYGKGEARPGRKMGHVTLG